jgi:hypothetical protein
VLADPGSAPKGVPETVCKELQELRTDEEPSETATSGASESMTLPVTSKQLNLGNFWPVEDAGGKTYAWSRDRGTIEITRLRPRTSFRVKLHLTDSAGRSKANIGTTGGALAAVPITALDIELPERVVSDDIGRMNIALEVEPWHPDGRTGDNRLLGVAVSSVLLSASP